MVDMGAEVGQKMRSAIKAKLTELDCYVDDELPDYIMVMVANKRTKTQMNEDLSLFLKKKTSTFVDWLHIVLKKLKEVTVTNLDVYKKGGKRKSNELLEAKINYKKIKKETLKSSDETIVKEEHKFDLDKSLTDDLPLNVNVKSISENRKIVLMTDSSQNNDTIPPTLEVEQPSLKQLEDIETQIKNVKSRLGFKVDEDIEESELRKLVEDSRRKSTVDKVLRNERKIVLDTSKTEEAASQVIGDKDGSVKESNFNNDDSNIRKEHSKIVFSKDDFRSSSRSPSRKKSVLDRLGTYGDGSSKSVMSRLGNFQWNDGNRETDKRCEDLRYRNTRKSKDVKDQHVREKNRKSAVERNGESQSKSGKDLRSHLSRGGSSLPFKKDMKKRLGLSSKITIPQIDPQLLDDTFKKREVVSVVKVKPRVLPPNVQQANKNLLLKAVADAQKSIAQSKPVGKNLKVNPAKLSGSFNCHEQTAVSPCNVKQRKVSQEGKEKLKQFLSSQSEESSDQEYIPIPIKKPTAKVEYFPSSLEKTEENDGNTEKKHKFIVTLDGIQKSDMVARLSVKDRLNSRKTPSPIIFDAGKSDTKTERKIPDELPIVPMAFSKKKEKCKYFPSCKHGEKCEFLHPVKMCEQFPFCKFGDKCLYIHPNCKFGTSCTKRDCPYSHSNGFGVKNPAAAITIKPQVMKVQICKFFPQCMNMNCIFYHPKPCKYGIYCKNQSVCNYIHTNFPSKNSLTWRSK
ncbi:zinc finger CCCH domain-containing protein 14 [Coccinella septempunctata]|uniref:zinc finger CCCH domain-containing protein 14 n=1 Tax=Coccinella septempunctata TaxID=41139 RepID=UPI001D06ABA8|nr:zinc finger CCCH domain-containing protein 14 [Coccinella septempunctata]